MSISNKLLKVGRLVTESLDYNYRGILKAADQYLQMEKLLHTNSTFCSKSMP